MKLSASKTYKELNNMKLCSIGGGDATVFMLLMVIDLICGTMNETDEDRM